ncbi:MAG: DUF3341 domain-containing protein [Planctomycetes bacterium]|nr:DUF3341 domain-containing protein [Planctomycetota bacterium]
MSNSSSDQNQYEPPVGVLGLFDDVDSLVNASRKMRDAGYTKWEAHSSFPIHGLDKAAGIKPTVLPWIVLCCGLLGTTCAMVMQYWMNAYDYKYIISGKPFFSLPANIPVAFEMTILFSAFGAFFGMHILNGFPRWSNPLFRMPEFSRVTGDRFAIVVDRKDPKFDEKGAFLSEIGAAQVLPVPADPTPNRFPIALHGAGLIMTLVALIPVVLILRARYTTSASPRIHVVPDMDFQWVRKGQTSSGHYKSGEAIFEDGRAMRLAVDGTVAVGSMEDDALRVFKNGDEYVTGYPLELTPELLDLGQVKYQINCAPCHGAGGMGDGPVHTRATELMGRGLATWAGATAIREAETTRNMANGQIFEASTNGIRTMPSYKSHLTPKERWAVVAYVRALQNTLK